MVRRSGKIVPTGRWAKTEFSLEGIRLKVAKTSPHLVRERRARAFRVVR
jgi:hypothetical protein